MKDNFPTVAGFFVRTWSNLCVARKCLAKAFDSSNLKAFFSVDLNSLGTDFCVFRSEVAMVGTPVHPGKLRCKLIRSET